MIIKLNSSQTHYDNNKSCIPQKNGKERQLGKTKKMGEGLCNKYKIEMSIFKNRQKKILFSITRTKRPSQNLSIFFWQRLK